MLFKNIILIIYISCCFPLNWELRQFSTWKIALHSPLSSGEVGNKSGEIVVLDFKGVLNWEYYGGSQSTIFYKNMLAPPSHETPGCPQ